MKLDKHEVKSPDLFLRTSDAFSKFISRHRSSVIGVIALVFFAAVAFTGFNVFKSAQEEKAQDLLFTARKKFNPKLTDIVSQDKKEGAFTDDVVQAYQNVIHQYPRTQGAVVAALELSQAFLDAKKNTEAIVALREVQPSIGDKNLLAGLFQFQIAKAFEANGQFQEAINELQKISDKYKIKSLKGEALLKTGICYEELHQPSMAASIYEKITKEIPEGASSRDSAKKYLRLLKQPKG